MNYAENNYSELAYSEETTIFISRFRIIYLFLQISCNITAFQASKRNVQLIPGFFKKDKFPAYSQFYLDEWKNLP